MTDNKWANKDMQTDKKMWRDMIGPLLKEESELDLRPLFQRDLIFYSLSIYISF